MGYPSWFFIAFPDVAFWAMKGDGLELIKKRFKNLFAVWDMYRKNLKINLFPCAIYFSCYIFNGFRRAINKF